jgi:hypothetical protein
MGTTTPTVRFNPRPVVMSLTAVAASLLVAHLTLVAITVVTGHDSVFGLVRLFDLDLENNFPSFFSTGLFLLNALLFWRVGQVTAQRQRSSVWSVLAVVFAFLATDEMFGIHERLVDPLRAMLHTTGVFHFPWIIAYAGPVLALTVSFLPTWRSLETPARVTLMVSASLYLFGAIGLEMISGAYADAFGQTRSLAWGLLVAVEESLEMAGLITLVHALLTLLSSATIEAPLVCVDFPSAVGTEQVTADL